MTRKADANFDADSIRDVSWDWREETCARRDPVEQRGDAITSQSALSTHQLVRSGRMRCVPTIHLRANEPIRRESRLVSLGGGGRGAGVGLVDGFLGGQENGADDLAVDHLGALGLGEHEPNNGERLMV